jgi:hypothetical protein
MQDAVTSVPAVWGEGYYFLFLVAAVVTDLEIVVADAYKCSSGKLTGIYLHLSFSRWN